jgi:UDP-N-acetylmuramoylalanine--D-glutamate ligase
MNASSRIGILGLARSGRAAAQLALARGHTVFASDGGDTPELRAAAASIREQGGHAELGGHTPARLAECDLIVVSPGIPPGTAVLQDPVLRRVPRVSELEFAFRHLSSPVIAVTGTNGKSTTTALIAHVLQHAGLDAPAAGNIGTALSEIALRDRSPNWVVVEASSFQLADIRSFAPRVGVLTNLAPDHLDRYPSVAAYYGDKAKLFRNATPQSVWVLNGEDEEVLRLANDAPGERRFFVVKPGSKRAGVTAYLASEGSLTLSEGGASIRLLNAAELPLLGMHNVANALAAALACRAAGVSAELIGAALRTFGGLEHRLERVAEHSGVLWINDSKATNIASTLVAITSMSRPTILLLGGRHKGEPYTPLLPAIRQHVKHVIAFGEAAEQIEGDLDGHAALTRVDGSFEDVVARAGAIAEQGDAVLLSPACSSFDMFRDYEERGRRFREIALSLETAEAANGA